MLKKDQKKSNQEELQKEPSGIKKLIKKVLTDKNVRNTAAMSAFLMTVTSVGVG